MFRPSFSVVSGVLVTLCLLALIASVLKPHLPPQATNHLSLSEEDFLRRAAHQAIDWQELEPGSLKRAKDERKPIFLVVGVVSSGLGQLLDKTAFNDDDIARFLNKNYIPIRVDGLHDPQWINAFFPVSRLKLEFLPGTQIWVLTPDGDLVDFIGRTRDDQSFDPSSMYRLVREAYSKYQRVKAGSDPAAANLIQRNDLAQLSAQTGSVLPPFYLYRASLESSVDMKHGGLPINGLQQLYPNAWRFMCLTGDLPLLRESLNPVLMSPLMDLLDGGFFRVSTSPDFSSIEFNKVALEQAEMLLTLTMAWSLTQDDLYLFAAENTFHALSTSMRAGNWVAAFQTEDNPMLRRSESYSFSVSQLRKGLSGFQRTWAAQNLGLEVFSNPQMIPYIKNSAILHDPIFPQVIDRLKFTRKGRATLSGIGFLEVEGTVAARILEAARLSGNKQWAKFGEDRLENLQAFATRRGLQRNVGTNQAEPGYLGDYLAFADAMLQGYLASGRRELFDRGLHQLLEVPKRFATSRTGEYRLTQASTPFKYTTLPELADNFRESCSARALRLFLAYGRLVESESQGMKLKALAAEIGNRLGLLAAEGGAVSGGFMCAAADWTDGMYAVTVGPRAVSDAARLAKAVPTRFVGPALGRTPSSPGIYIVDGEVLGPFSFDEAYRRFPRVLSLPEQP